MTFLYQEIVQICEYGFSNMAKTNILAILNIEIHHKEGEINWTNSERMHFRSQNDNLGTISWFFGKQTADNVTKLFWPYRILASSTWGQKCIFLEIFDSWKYWFQKNIDFSGESR